MKIQIRKIRPEGMHSEESMAPESIGLTRKDNVHFILPVNVIARINRAEDELLVDIDAKSRYESFCYRCLEDVTRDWEANFSLNFELNKQTEFIELDEDIRQEIILNVPSRILCQDQCKGICIDCGANLNQTICQHHKSAVGSA